MNPIPGPIILLALPPLVAAVVYTLRRWALPSALLSALASGGLALLCLRLPLDRAAIVLNQQVAFGRPVVVLGQTLVVDTAGQLWLAFLFALTTIFFLFAWRISQGRSFYAFGLLILSLSGLVTMLQDFSLAILVFAISTTFAVFIIQGGQQSSIRGAQRYLLVTFLAVPFLLAAAWLLDQAALDPGNADLARSALLPDVLGFGLVLAVFPFGTWMPALAADAPPMVTVFVFTINQSMALFLALRFLNDYPSVLTASAAPAAIQLAGLVMAASAGLMASVQRDFGRLLGYAALSDLGLLLLAFATGGSQSLELALLHLVGRSLSLTLWAAALSILRHRATTDRFAELRGVARRLPLTTMGLLLGGLALSGFPLTAGFPTHWAVGRAMWNWVQPLATPAANAAPGQQWVGVLTAVALFASSAGIVVGLLRGLSAMLGDAERQDMERQPFLASLMLLAMAGLVIALGLYPQLFFASIQQAAGAFALF